MPLSNSAVSAGRLLLFQILYLTCGFAMQAEPLSEPAKNLRQLQALRAGESMRELGWTINEDFVPKRVRAMLTRTKHNMRDQIVAAMGQDMDAGAPPDAIEAAIARRFEQAGLREHRGDSSLRYARRFVLQAAEVPGQPELRAITLVIGIPLGDDSSLYIFAHGPSGWRLVLSSEVNGYVSVAKAQSRIRYQVSPSAGDGSWFVVTGGISNHYASAWQVLTYTAQMPGDDPEHPRVLVREKSTIYIGGFEDERQAFQLLLSANGFHIEFPRDFGPNQTGIVWAVYSYDIAEGRARPHAPECHLNRVRGRRIACP